MRWSIFTDMLQLRCRLVYVCTYQDCMLGVKDGARRRAVWPVDEDLEWRPLLGVRRHRARHRDRGVRTDAGQVRAPTFTRIWKCEAGVSAIITLSNHPAYDGKAEPSRREFHSTAVCNFEGTLLPHTYLDSRT